MCGLDLSCCRGLLPSYIVLHHKHLETLLQAFPYLSIVVQTVAQHRPMDSHSNRLEGVTGVYICVSAGIRAEAS